MAVLMGVRSRTSSWLSHHCWCWKQELKRTQVRSLLMASCIDFEPLPHPNSGRLPERVIAWIFIGLLAGWLATRIMGGRGGLMRNLAVGLVGAIVGGFLFEKLKLEVVPDFWGNLITATIGAIVFLLIWRAIRSA